MTTDIANLGISVETSDLSVAVSKLKDLKSEAVSTATGMAASGAQMTSANLAAANATAQLAKAEVAKANAVLRATMASKTATSETRTAAREAVRQANATYAAAAAERERTKAMILATSAAERMEQAIRASNAAAAQTPAATRAGSAAVGIANDQMPNRFNTANVAAQFQDVGVTAAMGMNPLLIALQQGTQLSAILNSMEKPLQGLVVAFKQVINPVSLMTIGFVALAAAILQFINWVKVAQGILGGIASILEVFASSLDAIVDVALAAAVGFGVWATALAAWRGIVLLCTVDLTALVTATMASGSAAVVAGARTAAAWAAASISAIRNIGATSAAALTAARSFATAATAAVVAGARIAAAWVIAAAPMLAFVAIVGGVMLALVVFREELKNLIGFDILDAIRSGINTLIGYFVGLFEGVYNMAVNLYKKLKGETGMSMGEAFAEGLSNALERDYIGMVAEGAAAAASGLRKYAAGIGLDDKKKKGGKTEAERYEDIVKGAQRRIATLRSEQAAIGLTEEATARLKYETDLLNEAQQKNVTLSAAQKSELMALAGTMAELEIATKQANETVEFLKDTTKSFASDFRSALEDGASAWEAFASAGLKAIDKIIDKMFDAGLDNLMTGLLGGLSGSGEGGGGGILDFVTGLFNAKGNAFGPAGVKAFAKGAAFSNSVVSSTTAFSYGGGKLGVMGEKGEEAVMPLERASDGSLGVRMVDGASGQVPPVINDVTINVGTEVNRNDVNMCKLAIAQLMQDGTIETRIQNATARGAM